MVRPGGAGPGGGTGRRPELLTESAGLTDLRANPLMLALMCILYRGTGFIPRSRPEVYEQCATLLFQKWDVRRRIHVELAMSRLVEPALRHVAYALFTQDEDSHAVTERQLVDTVTEFLVGRGYEAREDAEVAARQFVGFCRGRAWVFTEVGLTARGEGLYTFTHRTFLEYFAAAQLAALSDTPEALARRLAPRVARQEWDIVGQLAVQIKERTTVDGAGRVFTALLDDRRRRSVAARGNVLAFLGRCLGYVDPPPGTARRLTRASVDHLLAGDPADEKFSGPTIALLGNSWHCRDVVADELSKAIADAVASEDGRRRRTGLLLAAYAGTAVDTEATPELWRFWWGFARTSIAEHAARLRAAARDHVSLLDACMSHGLTDLNHHLRSGDLTLSSLFAVWRFGIFSGDHLWSPYAFRCLVQFLRYEEDSRPLRESTPRDCSAVGAWVREHPGPPWADQPSDVSHYFEYLLEDLETQAHDPAPPDVLDTDGFLGAAVLLLTTLEACADPPETERLVNMLGPLAALGPYMQARRTGNGVALPDLPVPEGQGDLLRAWARREVDFVRRP
ncbi:hypothetical protein [Streptomyces sp. NPDC046909]|uniref:NACHT domain-containing protein n=1 Tax=Streptomyces sp. NPDC046909 TaxID=3155617 RepID=UPI0034037EF9